MKLLRDIQSAGAPCDYLYARIRCRRASLDLTGLDESGGPGDPRTALRSQYVWVYTQMNRKLRGLLLPVFEYFELRTLVISLRFMAAGDRTSMQSQLRSSLFHPQLLKLLGEAQQVSLAMAGMERFLAGDYPYFQELPETYLRQGPGGMETALVGGCLQRGMANSSSRPVREFLCYLLDMRNLLALYKHLRWQVPVAPPILSGGTLEPKVYINVWRAADLTFLLEMMRKRAALSGSPEEEGVEDFLLRGLTNLLRRRGREPLQPGLVIDYLWRCQLAARNRGLSLTGTETFQTVEEAG